ncbi:MAG: 4Fe-4S dicluster domain-containing protein [Thermodesulfobacteriota bacterium]
MFFNVALIVSLVVFGIGLIYKVSTWFRRKIGRGADRYSATMRFAAAIKGIAGVFFSRNIFTLIRVFIVDVLLQMRIFKEDFLRWLMHMLIFAGFMLLLLMHALDKLITAKIFSDYYATLNPFMFLRDLFGLMVVAGVAIAVYRRFILKVPRLKTSGMDLYAILIVAVIMVSGILLEGVKLTSPTVFRNMVEQYGSLDDEEQVKALESLWVKDFGLVSAEVGGPFEEDILEKGREIHEESCAACHSPTKWAFGGYASAKALRPIALGLDDAGAADMLWYIHILACFLGLAYLPFSKMFHVFASPLSLMAAAVMNKETSHPANIATRQAMELDACMHCCTCSLRCSVAPACDRFNNSNILPSEKLAFLKTYADGKALGEKGMSAIQEGIYLCTNCDRCTVVCPAGINLRELWFNVREELIHKGVPTAMMLTPFSFYRGLNRQSLEAETYGKPLDAAAGAISAKFKMIDAPDQVVVLNAADKGLKGQADASSQANTYAYCFACENCSTVCPVVENYENPQAVLKLLPHQIMRSLGLGLKDLAMGSAMLWNCLTCYQCQEHCPQGVKVTDVLYELKNLAVKEARQTNGSRPPMEDQSKE